MISLTSPLMEPFTSTTLIIHICVPPEARHNLEEHMKTKFAMLPDDSVLALIEHSDQQQVIFLYMITHIENTIPGEVKIRIADILLFLLEQQRLGQIDSIEFELVERQRPRL